MSQETFYAALVYISAPWDPSGNSHAINSAQKTGVVTKEEATALMDIVEKVKSSKDFKVAVQ